MRLHPILSSLLLIAPLAVNAQQHPTDTVIVPLGESSKIIFTIEDRKDIEILRHYDFQELFDDIFDKLEISGGDSSSIAERHQNDSASHEEKYDDSDEVTADEEHYDEDAENEKWMKSRRGKVGQTWQSYNIDLGTNNYLQNGKFPNGGEQYAVRPWGSWYIATNSVQRTRLGNNMFIEWSLGVSWYSFKFEQHNTLIQKDETGVQFLADNREVDYVKSKLGATFVNFALVPVLDFSDHSHKPRIWEHRDGFRIGIGPYIGYRIGTKTKLVYEEDGDRQKEKEYDNFYLNTLRYGIRLQIGVQSTDLFINYDINELFSEGKGPELNAISFGLTF